GANSTTTKSGGCKWMRTANVSSTASPALMNAAPALNELHDLSRKRKAPIIDGPASGFVLHDQSHGARVGVTRRKPRGPDGGTSWIERRYTLSAGATPGSTRVSLLTRNVVCEW